MERRKLLSRSSLALIGLGAVLGATGTALLAGFRGSDRFPDIPAGAYYDEAVGEFVDLGVIKGFEDGTYHPDEAVTRGQIAVLLKRLRDEIKGVSTAARRREVSVSTPTTTSSSTPAERVTSPAGSFRFTLGKFSVKESDGQAIISIIRSGGSKGAVTVAFEATQGSATAGEDYSAATETLSFAEDETSKQLTIAIRNDELVEGPESVNLALGNPTGGALLGTPASATLTISDDEAASSGAQTTTSAGAIASASSVSSAVGGVLTFSATAYEMSENGGSVSVTALRKGTVTKAVSVNYATTDGTARSGVDYTAASGVLNFAENETAKTFTVPLIDRAGIQGNRNVTLKLLTPAAGAVIGNPTSVTLTIADDDIATFGAGNFKFSSSSYEAGEGDGEVTITVSRVSGTVGEASVQYATSDGTARSGEDYTATSGTLTFLPGESKKTFAIPLLKDTPSDPDEKVGLSLTSPTGGATLVEPSTAVLAIYE